jgi:hypothetical protein
MGLLSHTPCVINTDLGGCLFMFDQAFFRKIVRISATLCFVIAVLTVALRFSSKGASCPALVGAPLSVFVTVALAWQAVFWRRTHDQIVATKTRFDDMGLNRLTEAINYNVLVMIVMAMFVGFSALPLVLYLAQCA